MGSGTVLKGTTKWWREAADEDEPVVTHVPVCYYLQHQSTSIDSLDRLLAAVISDSPQYDRSTAEIVFVREGSVTGPWLAVEVFMPIAMFKELDSKSYIGFVYEVIRHGEKQA